MGSNSNYIVGDSRSIKDIFATIDIKSPDLIISSPPYFDVLNYNNNLEQIGFGQSDYTEYLNDVCRVFQDCYDLSTEDSSFWMIVDTFKKDGVLKVLPFDIVSNLQRQNKKTWILKEIIVWDKEKNLPWNGHGHFKNQFEYILFFTKSQEFFFSIDEVREIDDLKKWWKTYPERYNPNGKAPSNLWTYTTALRGWGNGKQEHLCPLPFPLIEKILTISSKEGDVVLDPFAGSGSVLALAEIMGRKPIGIDINSEYKEIFEKQVIIGALDYWKRREIELLNNTPYLTDFSTTNKILRVHKAAALLTEEIKNNNLGNYFRALIYEANLESSTFTLLVIAENNNIIIPQNSVSTLKVLKQAKVTYEVKTLTIEEFKVIKNIKEVTFYKYSGKIYTYTSTAPYQSLINMDTNLNSNIFYSIFPLKLK